MPVRLPEGTPDGVPDLTSVPGIKALRDTMATALRESTDSGVTFTAPRLVVVQVQIPCSPSGTCPRVLSLTIDTVLPGSDPPPTYRGPRVVLTYDASNRLKAIQLRVQQ